MDREPAPAPTAADVRRAAMNLLARREYARAELSRRLVAREWPEDLVSAVLDDLVAENLDFFGGIYGVKGQRFRERAGYVLSMAGLQGHDREPAKNLSGGWRQRLALGCAIMHEPEMLFLVDDALVGIEAAPLTASPPLWPSSNTTRVDATFSARRNRVATSSIEGNMAKSSGRSAYTVTNRTTRESAILNVKNTSSTNAGSGSTIIASNMRMSSGAPMPRAPALRNTPMTSSISLLLHRCACGRKSPLIPV